MAFVKVLDNYTGVVKATGSVALGGRNFTTVIVEGNDGGAIGAIKATVGTPDGDIEADVFWQRPDTTAWLQHTITEEGILQGIPCNGFKEMRIEFTGGTGLVALNVWIDGMSSMS